MTVTLSADLERMINERVESGQYASADAVIRTALELLDEEEHLRHVRLDELRKEIAIGIGQIERGEFTVYDENTLKDHFEAVKREGRRLLAEQGQKPGSA